MSMPAPPTVVHSPRVFRIESRDPRLGQLLPDQHGKTMFSNRSLAVAIAVKSVVDPTRQQVRVVHVPTGEIVFETRQISATKFV